MKKRLHVYYDGRVQGVGFRFTVEYVAQELNLTGWVKNLPDDRVELIAEGPQDSLKELLKKIEERMQPYISNQTVDWQMPTDEFEEFGIRFY